jgi:hypothetical protein
VRYTTLSCALRVYLTREGDSNSADDRNIMRATKDSTISRYNADAEESSVPCVCACLCIRVHALAHLSYTFEDKGN